MAIVLKTPTINTANVVYAKLIVVCTILTKRIEDAEVVDPKAMRGNTVLFSATVTLATEDGAGSHLSNRRKDELDPKNGKISWKSPVAKAVLGKKLGEEVRIVKPSGEEFVTIENIEYK